MIEVKNVQKTFGFAKKYALRDVSFKIRKRETFAVVGMDGAGKTTLLNVLAGCTPPSAGCVIVDGVDLYAKPQECIRSIGYMPARMFMYPEMTAGEYISYMFKIKGGKLTGSAEEDVLEACGLEHRRHSLIGALSGFETAKLKLAQAIAGNVSTLILDEPASGLKREEAAMLRGILKKLRGKYTFIMASKMLREATELCEDVLVMNKGKIAVNTSITKLTSGAAAIAVLRLRIYADEEKTEEFVLSISRDADVERIPSVEIGASDMLLTFPADKDIRPLIWQETVRRNIPILEMTRKDVSLEEIFLQMTGEG